MTNDNDSATTTSGVGDCSSEVSQAYHDQNDDHSLTESVLDAIAAASDQPGEQPSVRLYDSVDPDALNALFAPTRSGDRRDVGSVSFSVGEFSVTVEASGRIFVRRSPPA